MKNRFIGLAAVCVFIPAMLLAQPAEKKTIVGVWAVKEVPVGQSQSPQLSLAMYGSDGSFTTGVGYKTLTPIPAVQKVANELASGFGRWALSSDGEFRLTFYSVMWKEGLANGYQRVQETLALSQSGDEYTGRAQMDFLDSNWSVVFSTTSDVKGTRLETPAMLIAQPAEKKQLVGVWEVKEAPVGERFEVLDFFQLRKSSQSPLFSLAMYGADGSFTTVGGYKPVPPIPAVQDVANELGSGYGQWAATGDKEFRLTFYSVMWKAGLVNGYQRVQDTFVLSESGDEYTGRAQVDFLDANWNVVFSTTRDVIGTRLETPIPAMIVGQAAEKDSLMGVWHLEVFTPGYHLHTVPGVDIHSADGSVIGTNNRKVGSDIAMGPLLARCVAIGPREFQLMGYNVELNDEGELWGFQRVQSISTSSESGDEFTGRATWTLLDTNWSVVFRGITDFKATRLETPGED